MKANENERWFRGSTGCRGCRHSCADSVVAEAVEERGGAGATRDADVVGRGRGKGGGKEEVNDDEEVVSSIVAELVDRASSSALDESPIDTSATQQDNLATVVAEKLALHEFLDSSASQSTRGGLQSALGSIKERELVVFFRNNHFSTAFSLTACCTTW